MSIREYGLYLTSCSDPGAQRITLSRFAASRGRSFLWVAKLTDLPTRESF